MPWTRAMLLAHWAATRPPGYAEAYFRYTNLATRCTNTGRKAYPRYGGRGVELRVSREAFIVWFLAQAAALGFTLPVGRRIHVDRIDNDKHYELGNMQLLTARENVRKAYRDMPDLVDKIRQNGHAAHAARRVRVEIGGVVFDSLSAASKHFGHTKTWINQRIAASASRMPDGTLITLLPKVPGHAVTRTAPAKRAFTGTASTYVAMTLVFRRSP